MRGGGGKGEGEGGGEGAGPPPPPRHKIQPGYRCVRVIRSAPKRLPLGDSRVYGQESCPQPENDHREDEKNSPYKPEGSFGERHKAMACTRFRRHRVRCFDGAGGGSWRDGSLPASSSLRLCG